MRKFPYDKKLLIGYGYVVIPKDTPREAYIENSLRTGRVSILTGTGEFYGKVRFSKTITNYLEFPEDYSEYGSLVITATYPLTKDPIIIGILSRAESVENIKEHQFILDKEYQGNLVTFLGDAEQARGIWNVVGEKSKIFISTFSPNKDSEIKFKTDSFILLNNSSVETSLEIKEISVGKSFNINIKDFESGEEFLKIEGSKTNFNISLGDDKVEIKGGVLFLNGRSGVSITSNSESLKTVLNNLINTISQSTVTVQGAPVPLNNAAQINQLTISLNKVLK